MNNNKKCYRSVKMNWYKKAQIDYKGEHSSPNKGSGAPIYNLSGIYPEDFYSPDGMRLYGHYGDSRDISSMSIIHSLKNKPNATVKIYRAVPYNPTIQEQISDLENQKKYIQKHGKMPPNAKSGVDLYKNKGWKPESTYYQYLIEEIERLEKLPERNESKITINPGDWVTINRDYAKEHGEDNLKGNYKIISKVVKAKDIYTDGDSIHEWGYDPS